MGRCFHLCKLCKCWSAGIQMPLSSASVSAERRNSLIAGILLGGKPRHAAPLDILGELGRFCLRRDSAPLAAGQGRFSLIDGRKDFQSPPLALFPKRHGFLHRILLAAEPASLNALSDERLLVWSQIQFHTSLRLGVWQSKCQACTASSTSRWSGCAQCALCSSGDKPRSFFRAISSATRCSASVEGR